MEFYSHKIYKLHLAEIEVYKEIDKMRGPYMDWPKSIANIFERSYPRIGILSLNDLVQEGNTAFFKSWPKLNQDLLNKQTDEAHRIAIITNYMKTAIKSSIRRAIASDRDTIRVPENKYNERDPAKQTDIFLTQSFADFFDSHLLDIPDEPYAFEQETTNEILVDHMDKNLTSIERQVVSMCYGIDQAHDTKKSFKSIAEWFGKSEAWAKKIKVEALKKLRQPENKEILLKNLNDAEIWRTGA